MPDTLEILARAASIFDGVGMLLALVAGVLLLRSGRTSLLGLGLVLVAVPGLLAAILFAVLPSFGDEATGDFMFEVWPWVNALICLVALVAGGLLVAGALRLSQPAG